MSNNNNVNNNGNLNIWIFFGHVKGKKVKCVRHSQREGPLWCRPLAPGTGGPARWPGDSWTAPEGRRGRTCREACDYPLPEKKQKIAICPQLAGAFSSEVGGWRRARPRPQVPWCYMPAFNRAAGGGGGRLGDSGGLGGSQSEGLGRARMRYRQPLAPGVRAAPPGLLAAGAGPGVAAGASAGPSPNRGAALPRPASSPDLSRGKKQKSVCLSVPFTWPQGHAFLSGHQHGRKVFCPFRPPPGWLGPRAPALQNRAPSAGPCGARDGAPTADTRAQLTELPPWLLTLRCGPRHAVRTGPLRAGWAPRLGLYSALSSSEGAPDCKGASGYLTASAPRGCLCCQNSGVHRASGGLGEAAASTRGRADSRPLPPLSTGRALGLWAT